MERDDHGQRPLGTLRQVEVHDLPCSVGTIGDVVVAHDSCGRRETRIAHVVTFLENLADVVSKL